MLVISVETFGLVSVDPGPVPDARNRNVVEVRTRDGRLWDVVEPEANTVEGLQRLLKEMRGTATHMSRAEFADHYGLGPWPDE